MTSVFKWFIKKCTYVIKYYQKKLSLFALLLLAGQASLVVCDATGADLYIVLSL